VLEEAWAPEYTYIGVIVDMVCIRKLQVGLSFYHFRVVYLISDEARVDVRRYKMGHNRGEEAEDQTRGLYCLLSRTYID
jgi:hypothetical protein